MRALRHVWLAAVAVAYLVSPAGAIAGDSGVVSLNYTWLDEDGHHGLNQPTYNTYEGVGVSLSNYRHEFTDGTYVVGDLQNITLKNRQLHLGVTRPGFSSVNLNLNQYRRVYSADGSDFTRRDAFSGNVWVDALPELRLAAGYGFHDKRGRFLDLYEVGEQPIRGDVDYRQQFYNGSVQYRHEQSTVKVEFRGTDFSDDLDNLGDRTSENWRVFGMTPLPSYRRVWVNGGYQHYEVWRSGAHADTLTANTVSTGVRVHLEDGWTARYNLLFDRAERAGDVDHTDNIMNSVSLQKVWRATGGLMGGYRHRSSDDSVDEIQTNGGFLSGWIQATSTLRLDGAVGVDQSDDQNDSTLRRDSDLTRWRLSLTHRLPIGRWRAHYESRTRDWDEIGSEVDYQRVGSDANFRLKRWGTVLLSYSYMTGDYDDATNAFTFDDHVVDGEFESEAYSGLTGLFGFTYLRSLNDLDTERSQIRVGGKYAFMDRYAFEVTYAKHDFDDLLEKETAPMYTRFYSADIVEVSLRTDLGR